MLHCGSLGVAVITTALCMAFASAYAFENSKYPDLKGQWVRAPVPGEKGSPPFDPSKPPGRGRQAPLTPEYQAVFEANQREQATRACRDTWPGPWCLAPGMPAMMTALQPDGNRGGCRDVTYIRIDYIRETRRRIYTDGRAWPSGPRQGSPALHRPLDRRGRRRQIDAIEVETRYFGPAPL